jgi:hypothetical protein
MKVRVLDSALIEDFTYEDSAELCSIIKTETEKIIEPFNSEKLNDWDIYFSFRYNYVKQILIYTKEKSNTKARNKEITIHIPMPIKEQAFWGVDKSQHIYDNENHLDHLIKNFICLDVDYSKFNNRNDYILDSMRRAIKSCFENGFTINGVKIKV